MKTTANKIIRTIITPPPLTLLGVGTNPATMTPANMTDTRYTLDPENLLGRYVMVSCAMWPIPFHECEVVLGANGFQANLGWVFIWQGEGAMKVSWTAPAERERRRRYRTHTAVVNSKIFRACESGVALRLPPQSMTRSHLRWHSHPAPRFDFSSSSD
ncbi:MAG: hypothetical protein WCS42_06365 [Verrucomicrobiota bacterium]